MSVPVGALKQARLNKTRIGNVVILFGLGGFAVGTYRYTIHRLREEELTKLAAELDDIRTAERDLAKYKEFGACNVGGGSGAPPVWPAHKQSTHPFLTHPPPPAAAHPDLAVKPRPATVGTPLK